MLACRCRLVALFVSSNLLLFSLYFERSFWIFERQICSLPPKFMRLYFVVAIYGLLLRAVASMRKFTARFLAPAACAVLSDRPCSWFINGALSTAGLCIFSAQSLGIPPCLCLFLAAHPFVMIDNFRLICFLSSPLALDLSPAPYRLSSHRRNQVSSANSKFTAFILCRNYAPFLNS